MTSTKLTRKQVEETSAKCAAGLMRGWWTDNDVLALCEKLLAMDEALMMALAEMRSVAGDDDCGCNRTPPLCVFCVARAARLGGEQ